jgi:hypothetical protein
MNTATCPNCGVILFPGELRDGECTSCMRPLPAPVQPERPVRRFGDGYEGEPLAAIRNLDRRDGTGWGTVRLGLDVLKVSLLVEMASILLGVGFQVPGWLDQSLGWEFSSWVVGSRVFLGIGSFLGILLWIVGLALSATAPRQSGLRGWTLSYLACLGMALFLGFASFFIAIVADSRHVWELRHLAELGLLPTGACALACAVLFLLYLRAIARYFRADALGGYFLIYLIVAASLTLFGIFGVTVLSILPPYYDLRELVLLVFGCGTVLILLALAACLWFLLHRLRKVIPGAGLAVPR